MQTVRYLIAQCHIAVLVCAAALLLKLLVPTGYMIVSDHGRVAIALCPGVAPLPAGATGAMDMTARTMAAMPGIHGDMPDHGKSKDHGKTEMPCAFSSLSAATLGAIDSVQLAALIAFVLGTALAAILPLALAKPRHLRPPLRAPPA